MKECLKLLAFVAVVLAIPILFLEGCVSTKVTIVDDDMRCVLTSTDFGIFKSGQLYEKSVIDCPPAEEETPQP